MYTDLTRIAKMKLATTAFLFLLLRFASAQIVETDHFDIGGLVKKPMAVSMVDLKALPQVDIADLTIFNHKGETKSTLRGLKGVALKPLLDSIQIDCERPKLLSEFYLTFEAADGYKVVFSWNEIFNSETGKNLYIVTERDGKSFGEMGDKLLLLTTSDQMTGRRMVKGLSKITVSRTQ